MGFAASKLKSLINFQYSILKQEGQEIWSEKVLKDKYFLPNVMLFQANKLKALSS